MDVQGSRPKRDRPIFVDILLIGAVMAALAYGGLRLLGRTHIAWEHREAEKTQVAAAAIESARQEQSRSEARRQLEQIRQERARIEAAQAQHAEMKNRRCIGGVLFAEVDGVLTNVGRC